MPQLVSAVVAALTCITMACEGGSPTGAEAELSARQAAGDRDWYVAPGGNNAATGTIGRPLASVNAAISRASSGDTIYLRGGTYHQTVTVDKDGLTIRAYGRERVVFDGTSAVSGWRKEGSYWVRDNWHHRFDHSPTYSWGAADSTEENWAFVNKSYPMAAWPDMVFVDGRRLSQVSSVAQVGPGRFAVDYANSKLYVGIDPTGREVRASTLDKAWTVRGRGTVMASMTVRGYASSVPHMGSVTLERPDIVLDRVAVVDNATTGISAIADGIRLRRVTSARNGMLGIHASGAYQLVMDRLKVVGNNVERFNQAPVSGGIKVHRSRHVTLRRSLISGNRGTGAWFDVSNYDVKVASNRIARNTGMGVFLEISDTAIVAGNVIVANGDHGLQVNNTGHVKVWNNAFLGNARPINIVQDGRLASAMSFPGYDPRRPTPDPTVPWVTRDVMVANNVVASPTPTGNCLLCVEDYTKLRSAEEMGVRANGNVYSRKAASQPLWVVVWSSGSYNPHVYETLREFKRATGQELRGVHTRRSVLTKAGWPTRYTRSLTSRVAQPLPADVARVLRRAASTRHLGPWR